MKKDQFFRLKATLMADDRIVLLLDTHGITGFGIYMALLIELRLRDNYRISLASLPSLARRWEVELEQLKNIVCHSKLFVLIENEGEETVFGSPYLDEVMQELEEKWRLQKAGGLVRRATAERAANGRFTTSAQLIENRTKENITTAAVAADASVSVYEGWEKYVDQAFDETAWLELQAMHSGMGVRFMEQKDCIGGLFKQHIRIYGKEASVMSVSEAKTYFSNFVRRGTPTFLRMEQLLNQQYVIAAQQDIYRFEQNDPQTGARSYCGMPIPEAAPPRPNANSFWDECLCQWS